MMVGPNRRYASRKQTSSRSNDKTQNTLTHISALIIATFEQMLNLGTVVVVDPAEHASLEELREAVGEVEVIWVEMGNTFALRHHLWRTGGDLLIEFSWMMAYCMSETESRLIY